jgi:hypothetical protein
MEHLKKKIPSNSEIVDFKLNNFDNFMARDLSWKKFLEFIYLVKKCPDIYGT